MMAFDKVNQMHDQDGVQDTLAMFGGAMTTVATRVMAMDHDHPHGHCHNFGHTHNFGHDHCHDNWGHNCEIVASLVCGPDTVHDCVGQCCHLVGEQFGQGMRNQKLALGQKEVLNPVSALCSCQMTLTEMHHCLLSLFVTNQ